MEKVPLPVKMTLVDPTQRMALGIPPAKQPIHNPFFNATELDKAGQYDKAEKAYIELLNSDFDNPVLHASLGMCLAVQEKNGLGAIMLRRALENIPGMMDGFKRLGVTPKDEKNHAQNLDTFLQNKRAEVINALGTCYKHENKIDEARRFFLEAQSLIPINADIQNNLGTLYINEGKPAEALKYLNVATTVQPGHPQASWNKSLAHLELGDYREGWALYDAGFDAKVRYERNYTQPQHPIPRWNGEKGKTVIVYGEQGIGDEIMFASCLPDLIRDSKQVIFDCHKKLHQLFLTNFPSIDIYPTREDQQIHWSSNADGSYRYPFEARVAIGSLPRFYRPTLESFPGTPFLHPDVAKEAEWAVKLSKLGPKPKVGINWIGGHKRTRIEVRSMQLEKMLPIFKAADVDFISLQYTDGDLDEITALEAKHGIKIHYFPEATHSEHYADCAALVANLDLVITVCTSVVHLAGAMGVPTWVLTPSRPAWRYRLDLDYMPWYGKTVTLFRQATDSIEWEPVVEEVAANLQDLYRPLKVKDHVQS